MAESQAERERVNATDLEEGDRIFMGIHLHGLTDDVPGTEYDEEIHQSGVRGTVVEALSDTEKEILEGGDLPMANLKVEADSGDVFTWNVDNGYVMGFNQKHDQYTDLGKIGGFYEV